MDDQRVAALVHYASEYYDPEKAHEYYMRTRELKGRCTTALNDEGKKVWAYTKNTIKSEKKSKVEEEQENRKKKIEALRAKAQATREEISDRLKELNEQLTKDASNKKEDVEEDKSSDLEDIEKKASSEIERLMAIKIPEGLSKDERAKRVAERNEKIAKLRNDVKADKSEVRTDAKAKKQSITEETKEDKAENSTKAKSERTKVSFELKAAVSAAKRSI